MSECYYKWCRHHSVSEPICTQPECVATDREMEMFSELREQELNANDEEVSRAFEFQSIN
jgi:hypothetical protein